MSFLMCKKKAPLKDTGNTISAEGASLFSLTPISIDLPECSQEPIGPYPCTESAMSSSPCSQKGNLETQCMTQNANHWLVRTAGVAI